LKRFTWVLKGDELAKRLYHLSNQASSDAGLLRAVGRQEPYIDQQAFPNPLAGAHFFTGTWKLLSSGGAEDRYKWTGSHAHARRRRGSVHVENHSHVSVLDQTFRQEVAKKYVSLVRLPDSRQYEEAICIPYYSPTAVFFSTIFQIIMSFSACAKRARCGERRIMRNDRIGLFFSNEFHQRLPHFLLIISRPPQHKPNYIPALEMGLWSRPSDHLNPRGQLSIQSASPTIPATPP
jgi:hypothetical protein